ncbi:MAG TPA: ABC transporter permease [Candidatus Tumulicola sp.]|nr:ABC transporter permease [Candidatus Tumulicola sp.]
MNKVLEFLAQALEVIWNNRLRSLLTMLGLIIGVGSVIAILAVGDSTTKSVQHILSPYSQSSALVLPKQNQPDPQNAAIRYDDVKRVARLVPDAVAVLPVMATSMDTRVNHTVKTIRVVTAGPGTGFDTTPLSEGRLFTSLDIDAHRRVCILSSQARKELFPGEASAVGRAVRLNGSDYMVVGVQADPLNAGLLGGNNGLITISIPYSLIPALGFTYVFGISVVASDPANVARVGNLAIEALKKIHGQRAQYQERDIKSLNDGIQKVFAILTGVIGVVAGISLIVGGVGIMNIMLVSVTERTREIGIRKAIGATRSDILVQFLTEAVLMCCIGGLIGLVSGVGLAELVIHTLISKLTPDIVNFAWPPIIAVSLIFSFGVAIVFGTYPAVRASYLNPIECLRYE